MQARLNIKVSNEILYHPGLSWLSQQLQKSLSGQLRGTFASLVHSLLSNPSCRVWGVLRCSSHPGPLHAQFIIKTAQVKAP